MKLGYQEEDPKRENDKLTRWSITRSGETGCNRLSRKGSVIICGQWQWRLPNFHQSCDDDEDVMTITCVSPIRRQGLHTAVYAIWHHTMVVLRTFSPVRLTIHQTFTIRLIPLSYFLRSNLLPNEAPQFNFSIRTALIRFRVLHFSHSPKQVPKKFKNTTHFF